MPVPQLSFRPSPALETSAEVLVLGVAKADDGPRLLTPAGSDDLAAIEAALAQIGATGAADELRRLPPLADGGPAIALIGVGATAAPDADALRSAAGAAVRQLAGVASLAIALPITTADGVRAVAEGAALAAYSFTAYRSSTAGLRSPASVVEILSASPIDDTEAALEHARATAEAVHLVRDLVNTSPLDLYPASFADRVLELVAGLPVRVEVLDEAALAAGGFGGILGVGAGSSRPPRLVTLRYEPADATRHLALVGKGITFDSGGLSLKPPASMVGMKYDMTGAATVLAATLAAARLGAPTRITAWLCLAENLPSGTATRPNDVLRIRGGATVEVLNTDAEGRLVLADGLVAASEEQPDAIVDVATLTGAARVAMGERVVPVMGDEELAGRIQSLGREVGEPFWPMPLPAELRGVLDSDVADIANAKPGNTAAGMLLAGVFLRHFVGTAGDGAEARPIPWAHLDIAGAANNGGAPYGATPKGPTGVATRTLVALAEDFARP